MQGFRHSGYDYIAPFYDDAVGLLFGKDIFDAQICFFHLIPPGASVLVLGGGSGWILPELFTFHPGVRVWYIDASEKMISLARKKSANLSVQFIQGTEADIPQGMLFDVVITNFYVDGFSASVLPGKIRTIQQHLPPHGQWIVTDFVETGQRKHQLALWLTHVFFRILVNHPNRRLVNWIEAFRTSGLHLEKEKEFHQGFIKTMLYVPPTSNV